MARLEVVPWSSARMNLLIGRGPLWRAQRNSAESAFRWIMATDQDVVGPTSDDAANERTDDRHPPPAIAPTEHVAAPAGHRGEEPRAKITGWVDGVAGIETEGHADRQHEQAHGDRADGGRGIQIPLVADGKDAADQERRAHDLIH